MIKSIRIELETTVLNLKIDDALVLRDELNKLFPVNVASPPSYSIPRGTNMLNGTDTIPCKDQYSVYSTSTTANPDESWNPAG